MPSDAMWAHLLEFEFVAKLGDKQFRRHEARLKGSRYGLVRFAFDQLRLQHRLRCVALDDFVEVVGDWIDSFALCRRYYYKENCLGPTDPLPVNAATPDRQEVDGELVLSMMVNDVFALAARGALTKDVIERLTVSATSAGLSAILEPWLVFVSGLFIDSTINAEVAVRDTSRAWPYQAAASIRVATDGATRPAELLTIHGYWAVVLPQAGRGLLVLADIEKLVTNAWLRLSENSFLLRASAVTLPVLREACAGASTGWRKIGEVLTAACDAVPPPVPVEIRERFRKLRQYGGSGDKKLSLALPAVTSGLGNGRNGANPAVRARWRQRRLWVD